MGLLLFFFLLPTLGWMKPGKVSLDIERTEEGALQKPSVHELYATEHPRCVCHWGVLGSQRREAGPRELCQGPEES